MTSVQKVPGFAKIIVQNRGELEGLPRIYQTNVPKRIDMPIVYYFPLSRREQNDHFMFRALFVTFPKSQIGEFVHNFIIIYLEPMKLLGINVG